MTRGLGKIATCLLATLALASCASVSVEESTDSVRRKMPEMVYVKTFTTAHSDFEVDRTGRELSDFKKNLQLMLKTATVADLTDRLLPAVAETNADHFRSQNAWLVCGRFKTVKQGSRLLRSAIGFGAGGTKVETYVEVYDLAEDPGTPFLTFDTSGGSNAEPGAILAFTTDPVQLAIGGVSGAAHGLSEDTKRTAHEITAELSDYMHTRGWISDGQWIKPKRPRDTDTW
jgi:hypothetical protein